MSQRQHSITKQCGKPKTEFNKRKKETPRSKEEKTNEQMNNLTSNYA